ncbi:hypothetical protein BpHYR1_002709 [Brachionus plicatilis]|uniref:Uncharacterized protein n=1 Tax=Brachionus plicatilis TaxID=10195 RepID=A0A3M7QIH4_BRAPC|nr:hypothetical protein BpHYR1_002709 [Brachionus plicatilis]
MKYERLYGDAKKENLKKLKNKSNTIKIIKPCKNDKKLTLLTLEQAFACYAVIYNKIFIPINNLSNY